MATITAAQAGNWSDTNTWTGGVVPGDGDTANCALYVVVLDIVRIPAVGTLLKLTGDDYRGYYSLALSTATFHDGASIYATTIGDGTGTAQNTVVVSSTATDHTLTVTGAIKGNNYAATCASALATGAGNYVVVGDVTGGGANGCHGIGPNAGALVSWTTMTITGNLTGGAGKAAAISGGYGFGTAVTLNSCTMTNHPDSNGGVAYGLAVIPTWTPGTGKPINWYSTDFSSDLPATSSVLDSDTVAGVAGTIATKTLSVLDDHVHAGYYAETTLHDVDADLAVGNIKSGVTIFGFAGEAAGGGGAINLDKMGAM